MTTPATFDVLACRTYLRLTQIELGRALGVTERQVRRWEAGAQPRKPYVQQMRGMMRQQGDTPVTIRQQSAAGEGRALSLGLLPSSFRV